MQITTHGENARLVKSGGTVNSYLQPGIRASLYVKWSNRIWCIGA
jgi:hypothetical protein